MTDPNHIQTMAFRFSNLFKKPGEGQEGSGWQYGRILWDRLGQCWNIPTILLLAALIASIWVFRCYCLEQPLDSTRFMEEWGLEVWVVLDALIFFLVLRLGGWLRYPALILVSFWGTVHLTSAKIYGNLLHYGQIASAMETTGSETAGYLQFVGFFPLFAFIGLFVFFWALTWKASRTGWFGLVMLACLSIAPVAELIFSAAIGEKYSQSYEFMRFPAEKMKDRYLNTLAYRYPTMIGQYFSIRNRLMDAGNKERTLPEGVSLPAGVTGDDIPRRIVIVLGESDWRAHHGAYGYPAGTDRFMMGRRKDQAHTAFFTAIAPSAVTREAVPRVMTFATARDMEPFTENMGIADMAEHAGYQTGWFSRQNMDGIYDTLVKVVAQQAEKTVYFNEGRDEVLVQPLVAEFKDRKQLFVMHIWGGHMWYEDRHDDIDYQRASRSSKEFRHYDAAIGHIDRVLEKLTEHGDGKTLFIYVPDHGEIVNLGHGTADLKGAQFDIPFYAWSSNAAYITRFRKAVNRYSINDGRLFNTSAFPFVMAEVMGYQVSEDARVKSLEESNYVFNVDGYAYPLSDIKWQ